MKTSLTTALILIFAGTASADQDISAAQVLDMLSAADGSVRVLVAGEVDMNLLEGVLVSLAAAPASAVRFGIADDVENRDEIMNRLRGDSSDRWGVCDLWLTPDGTPVDRARAVAALGGFGGSLIVLDNGENDEDRFHPESGDDPNLGRDTNPIIYGFLDPLTDWGVMANPVEYEASWNAFVYDFPLDMSEAGCK